MTRSDLVEELAARFPQLTHRDAEFAVKALLDAMSERVMCTALRELETATGWSLATGGCFKLSQSSTHDPQ